MKYCIKSALPQSRYLNIEAIKQIDRTGPVEFQLSSWRPGRYELGNFARNLRGLQAFDKNNNALPVHKITKDRWRIDEVPAGEVILRYEYYAAQPDAGACWVDEHVMYVNPVHCLLFDPEAIQEACFIDLQMTGDRQVACALPEVEKKMYRAANVHELLDSPFFVAKDIHHRTYSANDYIFHIWLYGESRPDWSRILKDFEAFTKVQLEMMKTFPVPEFHFMLLLLPFPFYHGVEHTACTVLALGPGYKLMQKELYTDLVGVASHELFHVWNVKTLRPKDFAAYDYTRENYSRLGWVYEGFTTYYGDLFLARSGFFGGSDFFSEINQRLQRHVDNYGRYNSSVAESSFDTWLDGYVPGAPARKTSIYDEGCLIALALDLYIRKSSKGKASLDVLFEQLYHDFAKGGKGYRESDILRLAVSLSDAGVGKIFDQCIHARRSYMEVLQELLPYVGCWINSSASRFLHEKSYGFRVLNENGISKASVVLPGSPAEKAGLSKEDEIIACNGWKVESNLSDLCGLQPNYCELLVFSQRKLKSLRMEASSTTWFDTVSLAKIEDADHFAREAYGSWTNLKW